MFIQIIKSQYRGQDEFSAYVFSEPGDAGNMGDKVVPVTVIKTTRPGGIEGYDFDTKYGTYEEAREKALAGLQKNTWYQRSEFREGLYEFHKPEPGEYVPSFANVVAALSV